MSKTLHIRDARKDEVHALINIGARAFKGRAMSEALFPKRLRAIDGQLMCSDAEKLQCQEESEFCVERLLRRIDDETEHFVVATDDHDAPIGYANWRSPLSNKPEEAKALESLLQEEHPKTMDMEALAVISKGIAVLEAAIRDALGEDEFRRSWYLAGLAVDPAHQRKGIGKMLMQWGQERADQEHTTVRLMASEVGANLYRALGFEEVGSLEVLGGMEYAFIKRATHDGAGTQTE
ncbi:unnamed protein product [Discula destructiva]